MGHDGHWDVLNLKSKSPSPVQNQKNQNQTDGHVEEIKPDRLENTAGKNRTDNQGKGEKDKYFVGGSSRELSCWSINGPVEYRRCTLFEAVAVPSSEHLGQPTEDVDLSELTTHHQQSPGVCAAQCCICVCAERTEKTQYSPTRSKISQSGHGNSTNSQGRVREPRSARPVCRLTQSSGTSKHGRYWPVKRVKRII